MGPSLVDVHPISSSRRTRERQAQTLDIYNHSRPRKAPGISLAEVLVAMFVIIVGISGVTATIWWGMKQTDHGKIISEASNLGRLCTENIIIRGLITAAPGAWPAANSGLNDSATERRAVAAVPLDILSFDIIGADGTALNNVASEATRFSRNISCTRLAPSGNTYDSELCVLTVRIYWRDRQGVERFVAQETITPHGKP
jgi:Tfp pilus assembly protein PilV